MRLISNYECQSFLHFDNVNNFSLNVKVKTFALANLYNIVSNLISFFLDSINSSKIQKTFSLNSPYFIYTDKKS